MRDGSLALVKLLLAKGNADVDQADKEGSTPLMIAAYNGYLAKLDALLLAGANPDLINKDKQTALEIAEEENHKHIVTRLKFHSKRKIIIMKEVDVVVSRQLATSLPSFDSKPQVCVEPSMQNWLLFSAILKQDQVPAWVFFYTKSFLAAADILPSEERIISQRFNRFFKPTVSEEESKTSEVVSSKPKSINKLRSFRYL